MCLDYGWRNVNGCHQIFGRCQEIDFQHAPLVTTYHSRNPVRRVHCARFCGYRRRKEIATDDRALDTRALPGNGNVALSLVIHLQGFNIIRLAGSQPQRCGSLGGELFPFERGCPGVRCRDLALAGGKRVGSQPQSGHVVARYPKYIITSGRWCHQAGESAGVRIRNEGWGRERGFQRRFGWIIRKRGRRCRGPSHDNTFTNLRWILPQVCPNLLNSRFIADSQPLARWIAGNYHTLQSNRQVQVGVRCSNAPPLRYCSNGVRRGNRLHPTRVFGRNWPAGACRDGNNEPSRHDRKDPMKSDPSGPEGSSWSIGANPMAPLPGIESYCHISAIGNIADNFKGFPTRVSRFSKIRA